MNHRLRILAGGAVKSLVLEAGVQLELQDGTGLQARFGAVGAMRDLLLGGEPCDVIIVSRSLIDGLAMIPDPVYPVINRASITDIGLVSTGIAVGQASAGVEALALPESLPPEWERAMTASDLKRLMLEASAIFIPDSVRSTAGAHVMGVLQQLGIADELAGSLREFPHGAAAMQALAAFDSAKAIGCTQKTEILMTPGLRYLYDLPEPFGLQTLYTGAITSQTQNAELAASLRDWMARDANAFKRQEFGFQKLNR